MKGRSARAKGSSYEREIAERLRCVYPKAKRGLGQARSGGEVADVTGTPWWIEAKRRKRVDVHKAIAQALAASDGRPVLVISRRDREKDLVTLHLDEFIRLVAKTLEDV